MALTDVILAQSPLGYWRTVSGTDQTASNLDLTEFGSPTAGASLDLSAPGDASIAVTGSNNLYDATNSSTFNLTTAVSLSCLMRPSVVGDAIHDIVRKNIYYGLLLSQAGKVQAVVSQANVLRVVTGTTTIVADTTYHVALTYDGTTLKLYVNGALDGSTSVTSPLDSVGGASFSIGYSGLGGIQGFKGDIDQVALFSTALVADDIADQYAAATAASIAFLYSGGDGNSDGEASLGGDPGAALDAGALFQAPTASEITAGLTDYRAIYVEAPSIPVTDLLVWVESPTSQTDTAEAIGTDPSNPAQTIANTTTAPTGVSFSAPAEGSALSLSDLDTGESAPVWVRRAITAGAANGARSFTLGLSWTDESGDQTATVDIAYTITLPITLYVDADHAAASDGWTRDEAADDPDHPFATVQAGAVLLRAGDTLQVEPSTLGNADPTNVKDPDVYAGIHHKRDPDGSDLLPAASNGGNLPVRVVGHIVDGVRPKLLRFEFREIDNWQFEGFQVGYDRGSGDDNNTVQVLQNCTDLLFTDVLYTGGAHYVISGHGVLEWNTCTVYSPWGGTTGFLDGVGFHLLGPDTATGLFPEDGCLWRFQSCHIEDIGGEDGIQAALGGPDHDVDLEVLDCTFKNILQSATPGAPHADAIQTTGARFVTLARNRWVDCDSVFIASDGLHERITIIDNMVDGAGNGFHGQGTSEWVIAQNTIRSSGISVAIGDRANQFNPDFVQKLTIVNNLIDQIDFAAGVVIDAASVVTNNVITRHPGLVTAWGTQITGLPELGTSDRLTEAGIEGDFELATDPADSPGIGDGRALAGLDMTGGEVTLAASDHLGRTFASPRDVGAFQSDPADGVTPAARAPYVIDRFPPENASGVSASATVTFTLVPVPGQQVDAGTVNASTVFVADATAGIHLPAVVTLGALADGEQDVTVEIFASLAPNREGDLFPLVLYTVTLDGVEDTQGSEVPVTSWSFRVAGTGGAAVIGAPSGPSADVTFTMSAIAAWVPGTTVNVYRHAEGIPGAPSGPVIASGVVTSQSTVTFTGLTEDVRYAAYAAGVRVTFMVPSPLYKTIRVR